MENDQKEFRTDESLRLIESMIYSTHRSIGDNRYYILRNYYNKLKA